MRMFSIHKKLKVFIWYLMSLILMNWSINSTCYTFDPIFIECMRIRLIFSFVTFTRLLSPNLKFGENYSLSPHKDRKFKSAELGHPFKLFFLFQLSWVSSDWIKFYRVYNLDFGRALKGWTQSRKQSSLSFHPHSHHLVNGNSSKRLNLTISSDVDHFDKPRTLKTIWFATLDLNMTRQNINCRGKLASRNLKTWKSTKVWVKTSIVRIKFIVKGPEASSSHSPDSTSFDFSHFIMYDVSWLVFTVVVWNCLPKITLSW